MLGLISGGAAPRPWEQYGSVSFSGEVVWRNVVAAAAATLWYPTPAGWRWNPAFPAIYTSLDEAVCLAERVKRSGRRLIQILVGRAKVTVNGIGDLTSPAVQSGFGVTPDQLTVEEDYAAPQRIAAAAYAAGLSGLLVPAAMVTVAELYPFILVRRGRQVSRIATPQVGTNLVLFPDNLPEHEFSEMDRYLAEIQGVSRSPRPAV
jgi:RES domain-containing protein